MEGYLKGTHRKLLKARKKYVFIENAKEMVWLLVWLSVTGRIFINYVLGSGRKQVKPFWDFLFCTFPFILGLAKAP